jgi:hypothetical protein
MNIELNENMVEEKRTDLDVELGLKEQLEVIQNQLKEIKSSECKINSTFILNLMHYITFRE